MMSDYEPASGFNLPPGCFEGDPRAPWNEPDPWEGKTCRECANLKRVVLKYAYNGGNGAEACCEDMDAIEEVDPEMPACEGFEPF